MLEDGSFMEDELTAMEMPTTGDRSRWWGLREHLPREPIFLALNVFSSRTADNNYNMVIPVNCEAIWEAVLEGNGKAEST